jgi:geranylgeranyl pyrophosphate synthase
MHTRDQELVGEAISILQASGSVEYATNMSKTLIDQAWSKLDKRIPDTKAKHYLKMFTDKLLSRKV